MRRVNSDDGNIHLSRPSRAADAAIEVIPAAIAFVVCVFVTALVASAALGRFEPKFGQLGETLLMVVAATIWFAGAAVVLAITSIVTNEHSSLPLSMTKGVLLAAIFLAFAYSSSVRGAFNALSSRWGTTGALAIYFATSAVSAATIQLVAHWRRQRTSAD